ncbi:MFS transporter [Microbacterium sp. NEAU-LLC]|uniref:MFS transporter n=1 Tax=Microbacterium helvum TaxID=2773713 RepID=A0ABR8NQP4_9MICO|nr:MFS transporter [Microbacterium helvum]MBD3942961.1 MFS transporter [Microbacterium helvum]
MTSTVPTDRATRVGSRGRAWTITVLLIVFMLINFGDKAVLGLAAAPIMEELNLTATQYGLASSAFYLLFSVSSIVVGFVANRVSNRLILLILAAVWALSQVSVVMASGLGLILVSRIVLGAAEGPANPLAVNAVQRWFPDQKRNLPTSLINLGAALGVVTLAPLLTWMITNHGWRSAFVLLAVIGAAWCVVWMIWGRDGDAGVAAASTTADSGEVLVASITRVPYRRIFLSGTGIAVFIAGFAAYWGLAQLVAWVPLYLGGPLQLGTTGSGLLVILPWLMGAIVIPVQGVVSDRLMQRGVSSRGARVLLSAVFMTIAAVSLVGMILAPAVPVKVALLTVGFSFATVQIAIGMTLIAEITPLSQRAASIATVTGVIGLAGIIAPALTGKLVDAAGVAAPGGYNTAFLIAAALFVVGALVLVLLARPVRDAARLTASATTAG